MSAITVAVSNRAIEYVRESLQGGLSLARTSLRRLTGGMPYAFVPAGTTVGRVEDLEHGGLGGSTIGDLAGLLVGRFPYALLIVELPLLKPGDPALGDEGYRILSCDDAVYAAVELANGLSAATETLRTADPSYMYNAFVLSMPSASDASGCPHEWLASGASDLLLTITGAYDGEGFILVPTSTL